MRIQVRRSQKQLNVQNIGMRRLVAILIGHISPRGREGPCSRQQENTFAARTLEGWRFDTARGDSRGNLPLEMSTPGNSLRSWLLCPHFVRALR